MRWFNAPQSLFYQLLLFFGLPLLVLGGISIYTHYFSAMNAATLAYDRTLLASARTVAERLVVRNGRLEADVPYVVLDSFERNMNDQLYYLTSPKKKTNHILHLLLCIPTFGLWLIVWGITMSSNNSHNRKIDRQIDRIVEYKAEGFSDTETFKQTKGDKADDDAFQLKVIFAVIVVGLYFYFR